MTGTAAIPAKAKANTARFLAIVRELYSGNGSPRNRRETCIAASQVMATAVIASGTQAAVKSEHDRARDKRSSVCIAQNHGQDELESHP